MAGIEDSDGQRRRGRRLAGTTATDTFTTTGDDEGTHVLSSVVFTSFENLEGLAGIDTFNLNDDLSGGVDGGTDDDIFNLNANRHRHG